MKDSEHFLESMMSLDSSVGDYADAMYFALTQVPKIDYDRWFGDIGGLGVYYANSRESRWFPNLTESMVATILAGEML